jgi:uncharacterized protein (TIRG00374 family)
VGGLLALLLLYYVFRGLDWAALGAVLRSAHPGLLFLVALLSVVTYAVRAWRWRTLLAPIARVGWFDLFSATVVGFTSGFLIPRAQEVVRPFLVSRRYPVPVSAGFAVIVFERLVDLGTVLLLLAAYLLVLPRPPQEQGGALLETLRAGAALTGLAAVAGLAVLVALYRHAERAQRWSDVLLRRFPRWLAEPAGKALASFAAGLHVLRAPPRHWLRILAESLVLWLLVAAGFQVTNAALGIALPFPAMFLLVAMLVVGVAIPTPGMVGGFHAFYLICLNQVFGVDRDAAAAAGLAAHAAANLPVVVLGLGLLGREGLTVGRVARMSADASSPGEVKP